MDTFLWSKVLEVGTDFPLQARGRLFSRHSDALNLEIDGSSELVSLVLDEQAMNTTSVLLRLERGRLDALPVTDGCAVTVYPSRVRLGPLLVLGLVKHQSGKEITGPPCYDGAIVAGAVEQAVFIRSSLPVLVEAILTIGRGRGFAPLARRLAGKPAWRPAGQVCGNTERAHTPDPFLRAAARLLDRMCGESADASAVAAFVGLGPGFTPSGDDFLAGMLAARALLGAHPVPATARSQIIGRTAGTTRPGATIVLQALAGRFPRYLQRFAAELAAAAATDGRNAFIRTAVARAAAHGHSSGIDAATGFAFGLTTTRSRFIVCP